MSVTHIGLVLDHLKARPALKLVAVVLADHADSDGVCWPSYRRIAERTGLDQRTVARNVKELIGMGVVTKLRTGTIMKVGDRTVKVSNAYRINDDVLRRMPLLQAMKLSTDSLLIGGRSAHLEVGTGVHHRGARVPTKPPTNHKTNRKSHERVDNVDGTSVGDVLNSIVFDGTIS